MTKRETSGELYKLKHGQGYSIRVNLPPDKTHVGWHWSKSRKVYGNKAEATAALVAYREELVNAKDDTPRTIGEYAEAFQESRQELGKVSERTLKRDKVEIDRIVKYLGEYALTELTAARIEKAYVKMAKDGVGKDAIHKTHMKLKRIMKKAYLEELISRNPCDAIEGISRPKQDPDKKKERRFTKEEAIRFAQVLQAEEKTGKVIAAWLALTTGMRRGEVLGLRWGDVDLKGKRLHVRKQLGEDNKLQEPKTLKSKRTIAIDNGTVALLKEWKDQQAQEFKKVRKEQANGSPVCCNELCGFIDLDNFSRWRRSFYVKHGFAHYAKEEKWTDARGIERVKRSGYVGPTFHALRHAQATLLVAGGVDPKTVQERLGHEKITTTLEIYAEAEEENDVEAASYINSLFGSK